MLTYNPKLKPHSRRLRTDMTEAEQKLWGRLRGKQLHGVQYYRQKPLGPYIVDFYGPKVKLVIELDGGPHDEESHRMRDTARDEWLRRQGLMVLRFDNLQMLRETEAVLEEIWRMMGERLGVCGKSPLAPLFQRGVYQWKVFLWCRKSPRRSPPLKKGG